MVAISSLLLECIKNYLFSHSALMRLTCLLSVGCLLMCTPQLIYIQPMSLSYAYVADIRHEYHFSSASLENKSMYYGESKM